MGEGVVMGIVGVLLAAGAGTRMGVPKGLMRGADGTTWVQRGVSALHEGGCAPTYVVIGAQADQVRELVPESGRIVVAGDWEQGMGASLRAGLRAARTGLTAEPDVLAVIISLVDTPGVTAQVVARLSAVAAPSMLARAAYAGVPGHPVLIGSDHWDGVIATATGDAGARAYLSGRDVILVEAADVASGRDYDTPGDLP
jgi:CTP:molybdopterin cytidylyltransferase MocA